MVQHLHLRGSLASIHTVTGLVDLSEKLHAASIRQADKPAQVPIAAVGR